MKTTHKRKVQIAKGFVQRLSLVPAGAHFRRPLSMFDNHLWDRRKAQVAARHARRNAGEHDRALKRRVGDEQR